MHFRDSHRTRWALNAGIAGAFRILPGSPGPKRNERAIGALAWTVAVAAAILLPGFHTFGSENNNSKTISGVVIEITSRKMTIQGDKGEAVTLDTHQDFTAEVAFGSEVTAVYVSRKGANLLESLTPPLENLFVSGPEIRNQIHQVIVLPDSQMAGAEALYDELEDYLKSRLNWYVKPRVMAEEIRRTSAGSDSALDLIDPNTGRFDMSRYAMSRADLVRKIADETRADGVIEASLDPVQAKFDANRRIAAWDGFEQSTSGRGLGRLAVIPIKGTIPALTLDLKLWNAQGKLLWTRRRGFTVLMMQQGMMGKLQAHPLPEALEDQAFVRQWLSSFFEPLLSPGERHASARKH